MTYLKEIIFRMWVSGGETNAIFMLLYMPIAENLIHTSMQFQECLHFLLYPVGIKAGAVKSSESSRPFSFPFFNTGPQRLFSLHHQKVTEGTCSSESRQNDLKVFKYSISAPFIYTRSSLGLHHEVQKLQG